MVSLAPSPARPLSGDPFADLVAELRDFAASAGQADGVGIVGTMLHDGVDRELRRLYRRRVVQPRRRRLHGILARARTAGLLPPTADLDCAVAACMGLFYARHLTGARPRADDAHRVAELAWTGLGGHRPARVVTRTVNSRPRV